MKFGYLDAQDLDRVGPLRLPGDTPANAALLARSRGADTKPQAYIGCAEYRAKEWVNVLYPKGTKEAQMLEQYTSQFNCMEMNGTHYRIYAPEHIEKWVAKTVQADFKYLPKFPQLITHQNNGPVALAQDTGLFMESVAAFGKHLGPMFLQFSESYNPHFRHELYRYLSTLPKEHTYFVELRHPHWFTDGFVVDEMLAVLRDMGIGLVITDTPGRRELCHMHLTLPKAFVRFVGKHSYPGTKLRVDKWMQRLKLWLDAGLQEVYFTVHTGLSAPVTAKYVVEQFNAVCGFELKAPVLYGEGVAGKAE